MDWLQFIVEITKAIAWPSVVVFVFLYLRKPLAGLVPFLEEFKYGDFVMKFRAGISEVKSETRALPQVPERTVRLLVPFEGLKKTLYEVAALSPTAAVIQAWAEFETKMMERAFAAGIFSSNDPSRGNSRLGHALLQGGIFSLADFQTFNKLRELRNVAAHKADAGLQVQDATEYIDLVIDLLARSSGMAGA